MIVELFTRDGKVKLPNWAVGATRAPAHRSTQTCMRCGGLGGSDKWKHTGWTCFRCGGSGTDPNLLIEKLYDAETLAKLDARKAKADARRAAKKEAERQAELARQAAERDQVAADWAELISEIDAELAHQHIDMLADVRAQIAERAKEPSDRQVEVVRNIITRNATERARRAAARHVGTIGERREFTLTLLFCSSEQTGQFPTIWSHWSLFTDENGSKIESKSAPWTLGLKSDRDGYIKGQTIRVKATVKNHRHDKKGEPVTRIDRPKNLEK